MLNLLLLLVFLSSTGIVAAWISENPGSVTIEWFHYRIDTSFGFLLLLSLLIAVTIAYAYIVLRRIILAPERFANRRSNRSYEKGLVELTYSVASLAASDVETAEKHAKKAEKILGRTPLTLLLSAQISKSQGDDAKTRALLEQMLDHKETEYLAARSLSDSASQNHLPTALAMAKRAEAINPQGVAQVIDLQIRLGAWQEALYAVDKAHVARAEKRRYKSMIYLEQGTQALDAAHPESALAAARLALKYAPKSISVTVFAARTMTANHQQQKAIKLITKKWKEAPHPDLAEAFRAVIAGEPREKQMKLMKKLASYHPDAEENAILR